MTKKSIVLLCLIFMVAAGCAPLQRGYETPIVSITSFEAQPSKGVIPQFQIGLHIVNPNRTALNLKGLAYTIFLEGRKIMTGVSNTLPRIEAYGEADVVLMASIDLFNSIGFFTDLVRNRKKDQIAYLFSARLDAGNLYPLIRASKKGTISLTQSMHTP